MKKLFGIQRNHFLINSIDKEINGRFPKQKSNDKALRDPYMFTENVAVTN